MRDEVSSEVPVDVADVACVASMLVRSHYSLADSTAALLAKKQVKRNINMISIF